MLHQLLVRAALDDVAVAHHEDEVGVLDGRQAVGDDKARPALRQLVHRTLNEKFRARIDRGRCLVEDQHRRILEHRAGDGQKLLLSRRDGRALAEHGVKALWQRVDKFVEAAGLADRFELLVRDTLHVIDQVLADRALKEPRVLQDHTKELVHILAAQVGRRHAVDRDAAAVDLEKSHQEVHHRGLARAGGADDGDLLARMDLSGEILDDDLVGRIGVAEAHVVERYRAAHGVELLGLVALVAELFTFEEVENAVRGGGGRLQIRHALCDLRQRRGEEAHIQDERDDDAEFDRAIDGQHRAEHAHGNIREVADHVHERLHHTGEELRAPVCVIDRRVQAVEVVEDLIDCAADAHDLMAGIHLLDIAVELAEALLPRGEVALRLRHDGDDQHHAKERDAQCDERHAPFGHEHHNKAADKLCRGADDGRQAVGKSLLER